MKRALISLLFLSFVSLAYSSCSSSSSSSSHYQRFPNSNTSCLGAICDLIDSERGWRLTKHFENSPLSSFDQDIRVTQRLYGRPGVYNRILKLKELDLDGVREMLEANPVPYVAGPDGKRYIIDRHHFLRAFYEYRNRLNSKLDINLDELQVRFQEVEVFGDSKSQDMSQAAFEKMMQRNKLVFYDHVGMKMKDLPQNIGNLEEDYFRGLAWIVAKSGAIDKTDVPFQEFYWADFFKRNLEFKRENFSLKKIKKAIKLAISSDASGLSGYKGKSTVKVGDAVARLKEKGILDWVQKL